ncbi:tRNA delta -isopentenylpyrophosphate [Cyclospora cayetanensis]|uniref:tRNA delta-isopentenylpyrophosphate n=1 Tax=Cyclospora cayetanensis TaxID=88456 RepID=A0A1D3DB48_9EIME|nr:tRNA delta -isopentenylpyrophosphate [Cyclospora cayetanensis]
MSSLGATRVPYGASVWGWMSLQITSLWAKGNLPVVVGGTQLYIELLLWESAVDVSHPSQDSVDGAAPAAAQARAATDSVGTAGVADPNTAQPSEAALNKMTDEELMELLQRLDSKRAKQLHPRDRRRVIRSIQVAHQFGVPHSTLMEQHTSGKMRYDACIFWLDLPDRVSHERRLRQRLAQMCQVSIKAGSLDLLLSIVESLLAREYLLALKGARPLQDGLLNEVRWLAKELQLRTWPPDESRGSPEDSSSAASETNDATSGGHRGRSSEGWRRGVLQGIGYKEFFPVILPRRGGELGSGSRGDPSECPTLESCVDLVVLRSLQYARQQRKWIKNKFLIRRRNVPLYYLEATDESLLRAATVASSSFTAVHYYCVLLRPVIVFASAAVASWKESVCGPALRIVEEFLEGRPFAESAELSAAMQMPGGCLASAATVDSTVAWHCSSTTMRQNAAEDAYTLRAVLVTVLRTEKGDGEKRLLD